MSKVFQNFIECHENTNKRQNQEINEEAINDEKIILA
jgi:hypothetical protein